SFHPVLPKGRPSDSVLPCGSPVIVIVLWAGTPSVPSSAIGKKILSPAVASRKAGAVRTGDGMGLCCDISANGVTPGQTATPRVGSTSARLITATMRDFVKRFVAEDGAPVESCRSPCLFPDEA